MTTFNTGNPLGSTDVYDRYDNSENLDNFSNGPLDSYPDRFGVSRQSLQGIRNASQYVDLGPYAAGMVFTSRNQVFSYLGEFYAPGPSITLPYTTTGVGAAEVANFRSVGDAVLRGDLASTGGGGLVTLDDGDTVQGYVDSLGATPGSLLIGWANGAHSVSAATAGQALINLQRTGVTGIFTTDPYLPGARFGKLAFRKMPGGQAQLLTDIGRFYPVGAKIDPSPKRLVFSQVTPAAFATTGSPNVYRSTNATNDFWGTAGTEQLPAAVIDSSTGRKYLDKRSYPATDYSCQVLNSAGIGGLVVEIKQPAGVPAPTTIVVELGYPVAADARAIYVDPVIGHDDFDGSSFEWPMKTIPAAIAKAPAVIFLRPGVYVQTNYPADYTGGDIAIRAIGGRAQFVSQSSTAGAWSLYSGNTYVSTIGGTSTPIGVVDLSRLDEFGAPDILVPVADLAAVAATPKSFWYDAGPRNMYIHVADGGVPSASSVRHYNSASTFRHSAPNSKVYLSDIDFIGGTGGAISARNANAAAVLITERCRFLGNYNSNGADIKDVGLCIAIDCVAAYNAADGFNYTAFNGVSPHFVEVGCYGYRNFGGPTGNGTTSHDSCIGLRINCDAAWNTGPGFADVGSAKTYNVNCSSHDNGPDINASGFRADGSAIVVLDGVSAFSNGGPDIDSTLGAPIYARDVSAFTFAGSVSVLP